MNSASQWNETDSACELLASEVSVYTPAVSNTDTEGGGGGVLSDRLRQVSALQGVNGNEWKTVRTYPWAMFTVYRTGELFVPTRKPIRYSVDTWSDMWLSTLEISAAQLRSVTEIERWQPFWCLTRSPIRLFFVPEYQSKSYPVVNIASVRFKEASVRREDECKLG